jgi:O-glycosyl hydrolase
MATDEHENQKRAQLGRRTFLGGSLGASVMVLAPPYSPVLAEDSSYVIQWTRYRQTILGLGYEIQSDSIGSGNMGLPEKRTSVPHDLVPSERSRFYNEMIRGGGDRGFRYCRLALGLYLRGLSEDGKNIVGRWPEQMDELRDMVVNSNLEGMSVEYWSPAPHWKSNNSYVGGSLRSDDQAFLSDFADAIVGDVQYLEDHGLRVCWWGLQNEPDIGTDYSSCTYTDGLYFNAFRTAASRLRARFPKVRIHVNSFGGQHGIGGAAIRSDAPTLALVDAWTWHRIGTDTQELSPRRGNFSDSIQGRVVYNNEFEYLHWHERHGAWYTVNTAQSIMNWMVFHESPTWFWLHALKPTYNSESPGYSLGTWRPEDDNDFTQFPDLAKGHWTWNPVNWNALAGFLRHMPWDSVRVEVDEPEVNDDRRIMAWVAPDGRRTFVITNRAETPHTFTVESGAGVRFTGSRYAHNINNLSLGVAAGQRLRIEVPSYSIEFWTEEVGAMDSHGLLVPTGS